MPHLMSHMRVIGLDILPGTSSAGKKGGKKSKFAVVIFSKNNADASDEKSEAILDKEIPEIEIFDLIGLIQAIQPDIIAFDNIFEIAQDSNEIMNLTRRFPDRTEIVQVTGSPNSGYQKLIRLAESQSFWDSKNGKPNSLESANLIAKLALAGVGYKVVPFEDEIKITISKTRNIGKGGWSAPRYERNMKISVNNVGNELINRLKVLEIDFDTFTYPKRTIVIVHPKRKHPISFTQLIAISKKISNDLAQARVSRIPKSSLEFVPLSGQAPSKFPSKVLQSVIVGVDPGTTTGLAIIDVKSGQLLALQSAREFSSSRIIRSIIQHGKTALICSDVRNPIPHLVQKLSKILNAQIYAPSNPKTPRSQKREIVQQWLAVINYSSRTDNHQRDALFAAIKGYNSIKLLISKVKSSLEEKPELNTKFDKIVDNVISGISVWDAISVAEAQLEAELLRKNIEQAQSQQVPTINPETIRTIEKQSHRIEELLLSLRLIEREKNTSQEEYRQLEKRQNKTMKALNQEKRQRSDRVAIDRRVEEKNRDISRLRNEIKQKDGKLVQAYGTIENLKRIRLIWQRGDLIALKPVQKLHEEELHKTHKELGIRPGDILLLLDPSGGSSSAAKWLIERSIRAIVVPKGYLKRLSSLARKVFEEDAEMPLFEEEIVSYNPDQPAHTRKKKIIFYEGLYIVNKRYLLQRIYEQELMYIKKREDYRLKKHREERIPDIPVNKHELELLLEAYQEKRVHQRLVATEQFISNHEDDFGEDF